MSEVPFISRNDHIDVIFQGRMVLYGIFKIFKIRNQSKFYNLIIYWQYIDLYFKLNQRLSGIIRFLKFAQ